jgi:hypothetical protein
MANLERAGGCQPGWCTEIENGSGPTVRESPKTSGACCRCCSPHAFWVRPTRENLFSRFSTLHSRDTVFKAPQYSANNAVLLRRVQFNQHVRTNGAAS